MCVYVCCVEYEHLIAPRLYDTHPPVVEFINERPFALLRCGRHLRRVLRRHTHTLLGRDSGGRPSLQKQCNRSSPADARICPVGCSCGHPSPGGLRALFLSLFSVVLLTRCSPIRLPHCTLRPSTLSLSLSLSLNLQLSNRGRPPPFISRRPRSLSLSPRAALPPALAAAACARTRSRLRRDGRRQRKPAIALPAG